VRRVLLLGASGFVGRNIAPHLKTRYDLFTPSRAELDLLNVSAVRRYLENSKFDIVIHLANPTGHNPLDKQGELFERSMRVFISLAGCTDLYGKMLYLGSGAEYGKHRDISQVSEDEFGQELPCDSYGLSRFIMNELAEKSDNIINLRVFGCYGKFDPTHKLIPHVMDCIGKDNPITLRQNTLFDFLYVEDIALVVTHFIENEPRHKAYNLCTGVPILTGDIAAKVRQQMQSDVPIVFEQEGFGLEYTGSNERLKAENPDWLPTDINEGIERILKYENRQM